MPAKSHKKSCGQKHKHKYKYPKKMLRKDGCLKKSSRKDAAAYRATHTQAGKRRKRKK